jgi:hypothetical protein
VIKCVSVFAAGQLISPGTPVSSTNKTYRHDIAKIFFENGIKHRKTKKSMYQYLHLFVSHEQLLVNISTYYILKNVS